MSEEVLAAYEELLSPEVPGILRHDVVDVLVEVGGRDAAPLLADAMHDPNPTIAYEALRGLVFPRITCIRCSCNCGPVASSIVYHCARV